MLLLLLLLQRIRFVERGSDRAATVDNRRLLLLLVFVRELVKMSRLVWHEGHFPFGAVAGVIAMTCADFWAGLMLLVMLTHQTRV